MNAVASLSPQATAAASPAPDLSMDLVDALDAADNPNLTLADARRALRVLSYSLADEVGMTLDELKEDSKGEPYTGI